jgi:hypothetical protein
MFKKHKIEKSEKAKLENFENSVHRRDRHPAQLANQSVRTRRVAVLAVPPSAAIELSGDIVPRARVARAAKMPTALTGWAGSRRRFSAFHLLRALAARIRAGPICRAPRLRRYRFLLFRPGDGG